MSDPTTEAPEGGGGLIDKQPLDIMRWPNLEHRFSADSPVKVGFGDAPVKVGFGESPVKVGFTDTPAQVNMNIVTPNAVGVNIAHATKEPVALRFVITEPIVAKSNYTIQLKVNGNEVFAVTIAGTTTLQTQATP